MLIRTVGDRKTRMLPTAAPTKRAGIIQRIINWSRKKRRNVAGTIRTTR